MILHMVLGSSVTTLSIVIPSLVLRRRAVPAVTTAPLAYVIVSTHYLLRSIT